MKRILLIDDDALFAATLERGLKRRGFAVDTTADAAAALRSVTLATFDGALLDLKLGGDNGLQLLGELLAAQPGLRVVVLTGYASLATAVEAIKRGAHDYLAKPASLDAIVRALDDSGDGPEPPMEDTLVPLKRLQWEHIQRALRDSGDNISAAARLLGLHRRSLQRMLAKRAQPER